MNNIRIQFIYIKKSNKMNKINRRSPLYAENASSTCIIHSWVNFWKYIYAFCFSQVAYKENVSLEWLVADPRHEICFWTRHLSYLVSNYGRQFTLCFISVLSYFSTVFRVFLERCRHLPFIKKNSITGHNISPFRTQGLETSEEYEIISYKLIV